MKKTALLPALSLFFFVVAPLHAQEKLNLQELLARHAQFLKKAEAPALHSRAIEGSVEMNVLVGGTGTLNGTAALFSAGPRQHLDMKFGHGSYDHETIISDGDKISVDLVNATRRSDLGLFLLTQDQLVKEGLFGGVLSAAWPLAEGAAGKAKLKYEGLKKVDGRELHVVRYRTERKGGDVEITLYFDANTYSHVRSTYQVSLRAGIVSTPGARETAQTEPGGPVRTETGETMGARQQTTRFRLEEEFDNFRNSEGYVVPAKWKIRYTMEAQQSRVWEWVVNVTGVKNNVSMDENQFKVK